MKSQLARKPEMYRFYIVDQAFESADRFITGAQLREMAHIEPEYRIFLEKHREENEKGGHPPDREVQDSDTLDLAEPGQEVFYTLHGPTFDYY